jgi:hypothetical protein
VRTPYQSASLTARRRIDLEESKLVFLINVLPLFMQERSSTPSAMGIDNESDQVP